MRSVQSPCGCAFSSVTRPWVAQRVWASPMVAGGASVATLPCPLPICSLTARLRLERFPTARTASMSPFESTETPAES